MKFKVPRGTKDILPDEIPLWHKIEATSRDTFELYGFDEIRTPIFESTSLFERGIGDDTDIIQKEMYTFTDKGDRSLTLRPEGTASVVRAYLENKLYASQPHSKLYYVGPMFRYERPQAGRYRQFHQIGVEHIGTNHPSADAEMIAMGYRLFEKLGMKNLKVLINTIGDDISRPVIEERIKQFLAVNLKNLSADLQKKFEHKPLRILDSKDEKVQLYLSGMPNMYDALSQNSKDHFNSVLDYLQALKIPFEVTPTLVRGLEYYNETVFEIISDDLDGAKNTLCGGGRYNGLVKEFGGPETPAVGFAFGVERAVMLLKKQGDQGTPLGNLFYVAPIGFAQKAKCFKLIDKLRSQGIRCEFDYSKDSLKTHLKAANKLGASHAIIFGDAEAEKKVAVVKEMKSGDQTEVSLTKLPRYLMKLCLL
jgi:histidyl-tRNA synthetase